MSVWKSHLIIKNRCRELKKTILDYVAISADFENNFSFKNVFDFDTQGQTLWWGIYQHVFEIVYLGKDKINTKIEPNMYTKRAKEGHSMHMYDLEFHVFIMFAVRNIMHQFVWSSFSRSHIWAK